jgi:hypothetical protein
MDHKVGVFSNGVKGGHGPDAVGLPYVPAIATFRPKHLQQGP